eukprot:99272-Heterocapsa_arctica.AAC.1
MRKSQMLVNNKQEHYEEGKTLRYKLEDKIDDMRTKLNNERTHRWRNRVESSWGHNKKDIYKWIRGKKGNGPLIVSS